MAKPRLTQQMAEVTGAAARSPGRFAGRSTSKVRALGPPYKRLNDHQKQIWRAFDEDMPWLGRSDRRLVGLAVRVQYEIEAEPMQVPVAMYAQMRMLLSAMGGTPTDRSKVDAPDKKNEDPLDEFLS